MIFGFARGGFKLCYWVLCFWFWVLGLFILGFWAPVGGLICSFECLSITGDLGVLIAHICLGSEFCFG